jgi:hypothetical protein
MPGRGRVLLPDVARRCPTAPLTAGSATGSCSAVPRRWSFRSTEQPDRGGSARPPERSDRTAVVPPGRTQPGLEGQACRPRTDRRPRPQPDRTAQRGSSMHRPPVGPPDAAARARRSTSPLRAIRRELPAHQVLPEPVLAPAAAPRTRRCDQVRPSVRSAPDRPAPTVLARPRSKLLRSGPDRPCSGTQDVAPPRHTTWRVAPRAKRRWTRRIGCAA